MLRLDRLRRSVRLAAFALIVFVLRVGIVTACAPSDLAEAMQPGAADVAAHVDAHDDGAPGDPAESSGHCLHCSCHHAVTLPDGIAPLPMVALAFCVHAPPRVQGLAPPDLSLRPPIV
jgi:hypothetical protein